MAYLPSFVTSQDLILEINVGIFTGELRGCFLVSGQVG